MNFGGVSVSRQTKHEKKTMGENSERFSVKNSENNNTENSDTSHNKQTQLRKKNPRDSLSLRNPTEKSPKSQDLSL